MRRIRLDPAKALFFSIFVTLTLQYEGTYAIELESKASEFGPNVALRSSDEISFSPWTILTMAPDGSWGAATNMSFGRALAKAISNCKEKYRGNIGCGYQHAAMRRGWSLAFRCGEENILVAERALADAVKRAKVRDQELRMLYTNLPTCRLLVSVDPYGEVTEWEFRSAKT